MIKHILSWEHPLHVLNQAQGSYKMVWWGMQPPIPKINHYANSAIVTRRYLEISEYIPKCTEENIKLVSMNNVWLLLHLFAIFGRRFVL